MDSHTKIKIFQNPNTSALEREVNEFLHPLKGNRIGTKHLVALQNGMVNVYAVMVEYIEVIPDKDDG